MLFANETTVEAVSGGLFPPYFGAMLLAILVVSLVSSLLLIPLYIVIDKATPGNLCKELLGREPGQPVPEPHKPNVALALVVAAMVLSVGFIIGCTILGVMIH